MRKIIGITAAALAMVAMACLFARAEKTDKTVVLDCAGKNVNVKNVKIILQSGARPRFAPDGKSFVFDRKNADGYYDLYAADLRGRIIHSLTENNPKVTQKNNGNGVFHPSGKYVIFISEEKDHFLNKKQYYGDPGVGIFCNLWAIEIAGKKTWKLTDIPIKKKLFDQVPARGIVNPHFTPDGKTLLWTERYAEGGNNNWGKWRIKAAALEIKNNVPTLKNEAVLYTPAKGTYVTFMGFPGVKKLLLAGNLDGQHEYGMDLYVYDLNTKQLTNLTNTPKLWEEDATITPSGRIIYMTNRHSPYAFDFENANWAGQPVERDYYIMDADGGNQERLTYFNDPSAPEYVGKRTLAAASDLSPDGKMLAASIGIDFGDKKRDMSLKIALLELK